MIRNIIFDLGNVLLDFNPNLILDTILNDCPQAKEAILQELFHSQEWRQTDEGRISTDQMKAIVSARIPQWKSEITRVCADWFCAMPPMPNMSELIIQLKKTGYNIYLLSNVSDMGKQKIDHIPAYNYFDGFVFSFEERMVKPYVEIYQILLDRFQLKADESIFIDDRKDNIETANRLGIHGIVFQNYETLLPQLNALLQKSLG